LFAVATVATVFLYSRPYLRQRNLHHGEYYILGLFALLGIMVLASGYSLLVIYLGLEILSLALYAMVAFDRDSAAGSEAAMKYFVLGAIASGFLLYGMSLVYGVTGSLAFADIRAAIAAGADVAVPLWVGLVFLVAGIAFKFGAVPLHMWVPDVYEGSPTCVTLFIGTAPKLGALALAVRLLVDAFPLLGPVWEPALAVLAVLSLAIGNVVAIAQSNIRRMLAYSTIGHVGFILLGLVAGPPDGVEAALFYTIVYVLMAAAAFGIVVLLSWRGVEATELDQLRGLGQRNPWFASMLLLIMVSMIGVPPLAGFYAKWWVLAALVDAGHIWLAVAAVVFSVIGAFYYLRVIRLMFFDAGGNAESGEVPIDLRVVLSVNALLLLLIGLAPDRLLELCARAISLA
jgi:NADH-quinone oxidoreductase subunit N